VNRHLDLARQQPGDRLAEGERTARVAVVYLLTDADKGGYDLELRFVDLDGVRHL
jgi:hypothetical protein